MRPDSPELPDFPPATVTESPDARSQSHIPSGFHWPVSDMVVTSSFAEATKLVILAIRMDGKIEYVNPAAEKLFGYARHEMVGQPISIIIPERLRGAHDRGLMRSATGAKPNLEGKTVEVFALHKDGREFPIEITLSLWENEQGKFAGALIKDITDRRDREDRLMRLANQDTLTGLHNRNQFIDLLRVELMARRPGAVYLLDLDGFKEVNDTHGHGAGDAVLQAIGVRLPYMLPHGAEVARFGGDEFAILIPGMDDKGAAAQMAVSILQSFSTPFEVNGYTCNVGASLGFVLTGRHEGDADELIASADLALYRAKAAGRQTHVMYDSWMRAETQALRDIRDELRVAIKRGELELFFQPQIRFADGSVIGFEALIRWNHPERGLLTPHAFLPALEQSSLALEIGWWTLDEACRQLKGLLLAGFQDLRVSVNLFSVQVRAANLTAKVAETLAKYGLEPKVLELEVTETIALYDDGRSLEVLTELRQMGVGIAFDDFGTGFASLSSIQRYPLTTLKIDRSFVRDLAQKPRDAAIVRALVSMSIDLGLDAIAEGIETPEQERVVRSLGCQTGQGYLYGRPMPGADLMQFFLRAALTDRVARTGTGGIAK